jgi:hypothetical protein
MEIRPYGDRAYHEIEELIHHGPGLLAVRVHAENGEEVYPHLDQARAILGELYEHGHLIGFLLDPHNHISHMRVEHVQPLYEIGNVSLGVAHFHHDGGYYGGHREGHHEGGLLHELGHELREIVEGEHHDHHGGHREHHDDHHYDGGHHGHHDDHHGW